MAINVGKNSTIAIMSDGTSVSLFNNYITNDMSKTYYFFSGQTNNIGNPEFTVDFNSYNNKRCLQYRLFSPSAYIHHNNNIVLIRNGKNIIPLMEAINVSCSYQSEIPALAVTFWSNLLEGMTCGLELSPESSWLLSEGIIKKKDDKFFQYKYDPNKVQTYKQKEYDDLTFGTSYKIIFCSAQINIENKRVLTQDQIDSNVDLDNIQEEKVMIIDGFPLVIDEIEDNYPLLDFSGMGGDGGGMRQHSHIPTIDGTNFAFAVFHPGTSMPQLPWEV